MSETVIAANPADPKQHDHGRFTPGQMVADRYRIVTILGRGGMGEVYRADDTTLGQSVALKFLPDRIAFDPVALGRFKAEILNARHVSHPNVCRIHDIGETSGRAFLSMEYVDGEDLSVALKRLGRPSKEKAGLVTRELCLGLAAAHEAGIIHRDLKPANVMLDGRGHVRIMDFGLAGLEEEQQYKDRMAGTPAYMAPELFDGEKASVRSDIYALGLVLYEIYTGRKAYEAKELAEIKSLHESSIPTTPSAIVADIDPEVDRVILRCLAKDPNERPASVYTIVGVLPEGNALAAFAAAGQTPSPELVANADVGGDVRPRTTAACLATILILLIIVSWLFSPRLLPLGESPDRLRLKSEDILASLGYTDLPRYSAAGFTVRSDLLDELRRDKRWPEAKDVAQTGALLYWARWSPNPLVHTSIHHSYPEIDDPPQTTPHSIKTLLDINGRLIGLVVIPGVLVPPNTQEAPSLAGLSSLWKAAGVDASGLELIEESTSPLIHGQQLQSWIGAAPGFAEPVTYKVGVVGGRPFFFSIADSSGLIQKVESREENIVDPATPTVGQWFDMIVQWIPLAAGVLLGFRNIRLRRGDARGATMVAVWTFSSFMLAAVFSINLSEASLPSILVRLGNERAFGHALMHAIPLWFFYIALEPYVRREWPRLLVSWARITTGKKGDLLVSRDVLFGGVAGFGGAAILGLGFALGGASSWMLPQVTPDPLELRALAGLDGLIRELATAAARAVLDSLGLLVFVFLAHLVVRNLGVALVVAFTIGVAQWVYSLGPMFGAFGGIVMGVSFTLTPLVVLFRYGLLSSIVSLFVLRSMIAIPVTFDLSVWYSKQTLWGLAIIFTLLGVAAYRLLCQRPVLRDFLGESADSG